MTLFDTARGLLPNGRAFNLTKNKRLKELFRGLSSVGDGAREFTDDTWSDLDPDLTRELEAWDEQFGNPRISSLSDAERRERLKGNWRAFGGQDPSYIQQTLRDAGFDVYVHDWWDPADTPAVGNPTCVMPRNPLMYLRREFTGVSIGVDCGDELAACGEDFAECGNGVEPLGYPLVNKIIRTEANITTLCGEAVAECGNGEMTCGNYDDFVTIPVAYTVPSDVDKWPYFVYIGGSTFGDLASVPTMRKDEFERLCLKICPAHLWIGVLVEYV